MSVCLSVCGCVLSHQLTHFSPQSKSLEKPFLGHWVLHRDPEELKFLGLLPEAAQGFARTELRGGRRGDRKEAEPVNVLDISMRKISSKES